MTLSTLVDAELERLGESPAPRKRHFGCDASPGLLLRLRDRGLELSVPLPCQVDGTDMTVVASLDRCVVVQDAEGSRRVLQTTAVLVDAASVRWVPVRRVVVKRGGWRTLERAG